VTPLGRSDKFIPVDTEAIRPEDVKLAYDWAATVNLTRLFLPTATATVRSWVMKWKLAARRHRRNLCAKFLEADSVSTP